MVEQYLSDNSTDILFQSAADVTWVPYNKFHVGDYEKAHHDKISDVVVLRINSKENTFTRAIMHKWTMDRLELEHNRNSEIQAHFAEVKHRTLKGLDPRINPDKPPRNFKAAMAALDNQAWAAAYNAEYIGFKERGVFKVVKPEPGVKILDTLTRLEYKEDNGEFIKCKARLCARGDQQVDGVNYKETDLYAPTLKAAEGRLLMAIAASNGHKIYKTDTKQAYLYGDMGDDIVYLRPPDWWPEPIPEGHVLLLVKSIYGTKQAARKWHTHISDWMIRNGYLAVNSEKTIFKKTKGSDYIIHGLFVDYMMHISSCDKLRAEFMKKYATDFEITGGGLMKTFLGMEVEQGDAGINLHLDHYVQTVLTEYKDYIKKSLRPKKVPISPGVVLHPDQVPAVPDKLKQKGIEPMTHHVAGCCSTILTNNPYVIRLHKCCPLLEKVLLQFSDIKC